MYADRERAAMNLRIGDIVERHMNDDDVVKYFFVITHADKYALTNCTARINRIQGSVQSSAIPAQDVHHGAQSQSVSLEDFQIQRFDATNCNSCF